MRKGNWKLYILCGILILIICYVSVELYYYLEFLKATERVYLRDVDIITPLTPFKFYARRYKLFKNLFWLYYNIRFGYYNKPKRK